MKDVVGLVLASFAGIGDAFRGEVVDKLDVTITKEAPNYRIG